VLGIALLAVTLGTSVEIVCKLPQELTITVAAIHKPAPVRNDLNLAQIEELQRNAGADTSHRAPGIYRSSFGYTVDVYPIGTPCAASVGVTVRLSLSDREIQIARDLARDDCVTHAALAYYARRAEADDAALSKFAARLKSVLQPVGILAPDANLTPADTLQNDIEARVRAIVDEELPWYDQTYAETQKDIPGFESWKRRDRECPSGE
jgi:hypothetical protein